MVPHRFDRRYSGKRGIVSLCEQFEASISLSRRDRDFTTTESLDAGKF